MKPTIQILRALRKLGFEGETLKSHFIYFSAIDPLYASVFLSAMLQAKEKSQRLVRTRRQRRV